MVSPKVAFAPSGVLLLLTLVLSVLLFFFHDKRRIRLDSAWSITLYVGLAVSTSAFVLGLLTYRHRGSRAHDQRLSMWRRVFGSPNPSVIARPEERAVVSDLLSSEDAAL
jgi:hypothetical protein